MSRLVPKIRNSGHPKTCLRSNVLFASVTTKHVELLKLRSNTIGCGSNEEAMQLRTSPGSECWLQSAHAYVYSAIQVLQRSEKLAGKKKLEHTERMRDLKSTLILRSYLAQMPDTA